MISPRDFFRFVAGTLVLLAALSVSAQDAGPRAAGEAAADAGDWEAARVAFEEAAALDDAAASWYRVGVARALTGDAFGAAEAFRAVREREPAFPQIEERIAAAEARVVYEADQAIDRPGFHDDTVIRLEARLDALQRDDLVYASRAASGLEPGVGPAADALEWRAHAEPEPSRDAALAAVAAEPGVVDHYLAAADALRLAGDFDAARYYLELYVDLGGDVLAAAPVRRALEAIDAPGR